MSETDHGRPEVGLFPPEELKNWGSIIEAGKEMRSMSTLSPSSLNDELGTWLFQDTGNSQTSLHEFYNQPCLTNIWQPTRSPKKPEAGTSKRLLEYETEPFTGYFWNMLRVHPYCKRECQISRSVEPKWFGHDFDKYTVTKLDRFFDDTNQENPMLEGKWVSVLDRHPDGNYFSWTGYRLTNTKGETLVLAAVNSEGGKFHDKKSAESKSYLKALRAPWQIPDTPPSEDSAAPTA